MFKPGDIVKRVKCTPTGTVNIPLEAIGEVEYCTKESIKLKEYAYKSIWVEDFELVHSDSLSKEINDLFTMGYRS